MRHRAICAACALSVAFQAAAFAQGELDEALVRAREGLKLSRRDREVALRLLRDWRESEAVAPGTGDPSLGRALEAMASGRALGPGETGALRRYETSCRENRYRATGHGLFSGNKHEPDGPVPVGPARASRVGTRFATWWFVPAAGAAVVILGAAWMFAVRARQRR